MKKFSFREWKNEIIAPSDIDGSGILSEWAEYIVRENKKGKIPLIIVGAGISARDVKIKKDNDFEFEWSQEGLPCLPQMMSKLKELVDAKEDVGNEEMLELKKQFDIMTEDMQNVNREWLGRIFTIFEKSANNEIKEIWRSFCEWFFFSCISYNGEPHGAIDTVTSKAAEQIVKMYDSVDAICLSANFDGYINYALTKTKGNQRGVPIFERIQAERYLKRNRRNKVKFEEKPHNRCVLHANGDIFWLYCSGENGEGYCPNTNVRKPAFDNKAIKNEKDLFCEFCGSPLVATMTMPGTYEKDYNTRTIIECIWKYLSAKISTVITVGISCNWDDVLLKFILQLMREMEIPLLDINDFSDKVKSGQSQLVELVVKQSHLEACSLKMSACEGIEKVNSLLEEKKAQLEAQNPPEENNYRLEMQRVLQSEESINRISKVSQLGLKSYWLETSEKNDRWSHSVEVAETAVNMYLRLTDNSKKNVSIQEQVLLYAAGLLHDCGHLPFSHLLEDVFGELAWNMQGETDTFAHAHYTKYLIKRLSSKTDNNFNKILQRFGISSEEIIHLIEGRYGIAYMDTLINSALDADKIAYIFTDAEKSKKNLALDKDTFLEKFLKDAYITQEGMVALDGESAWYAMRLLDERQRMYNELYYDTRIRCLEAMAKYIITTYFVQKYNRITYETDLSGVEDGTVDFEDMGNRHILDAIDDLHKMIEDGHTYIRENFSASLGERVKETIEQCMRFIMRAGRIRNSKIPDEIKILQVMCAQLLGKEVTSDGKEENLSIYIPYVDHQLDELAERMSYEDLLTIRKKIILNYPGTILIDVYKTTKYFSPSSLRAAKKRPDGTNCEQTTILVPSEDKSEWQIRQSPAEISVSEYAEKERIDKERRVVFHIFKIGRDTTECEYAISMLKKEMKRMRR